MADIEDYKIDYDVPEEIEDRLRNYSYHSLDMRNLNDLTMLEVGKKADAAGEPEQDFSAANLDVEQNLTVKGNFTVEGQLIARDKEHVAGDMQLGDEDSDRIEVRGHLVSGHSAGSVSVQDSLGVKDGIGVGESYGSGVIPANGMVVEGSLGVGTTTPVEKLEVEGNVKAVKVISTEAEINQLHTDTVDVGGVLTSHTVKNTNLESETITVTGAVNAGSVETPSMSSAAGTVTALQSETVNAGSVTTGTLNAEDAQGVSLNYTDANHETLRVNGTLRLRKGVAVDEIKNGILVPCETSVPTEKTVKDYVDTKANLAGDPLQNFESAELGVKGNLTVDGKLGLGVALPAEKLEVDGNIKAATVLASDVETTNLTTSTITAGGAVQTGSLSTGSLTLQSGVPVDKISNELLSDSPNSLPTEKTVKDYVDTRASLGGDPAQDFASKDLRVHGTLTVDGQMMAKDAEHVAGDVVLGDEDTDQVTLKGALLSGHSSGALQIQDTVNVKEGLSVGATYMNAQTAVPPGGLLVEGNLGVGVATPTEKLEVNGTIKSSRLTTSAAEITELTAVRIQNTESLNSASIVSPSLDATNVQATNLNADTAGVGSLAVSGEMSLKTGPAVDAVNGGALGQSATALATEQTIKAYIDAKITEVNERIDGFEPWLINGEYPFMIKEFVFGETGDTFDTEVDANEYEAGILGFSAEPRPAHWQKYHDDRIKMYPFVEEGTWHICANLRDNWHRMEQWKVRVVFIRKEIVGDFTV